MLFKSIFRYFGFTILAIITLEGGARLDDWINEGANLWRPYTMEALFRPSQFGKEGIPGARYSKWAMNSLGYRGPDLVPGRINVVTLGASETIGLYESPGHEYPRQLETLLNSGEGASRYNVVNLAIFGMRIGRTGYLVRGIEQVGAKVAIIYPSPANYIGTSTPLCGKPTLPVHSEIGLLDQLRIAGKTEQLIKSHMPVQIMTAIRQLSIWNETRKYGKLDKVPQSNLDALKVDLTCAAIAAQKAGARVILVTHANLFGSNLKKADEAMMVAWRRFYPKISSEGMLDFEKRANLMIKEVGQETGSQIVDAGANIPPGVENFADFVHFSDAGALLMAKALAPTVRANSNADAFRNLNAR